MKQMKFNRELYSKVALIKAAYNFTDIAYLHLDSDENYYYVSIEFKDDNSEISNSDFENEMLTQSVRHEVYKQTKNIRELMLARAVATSVIAPENHDMTNEITSDEYTENDILKDWFLENE